MKKRVNSIAVWDEVWKDEGLVRAAKLVVTAEAASIRWRRIKQILLREKRQLSGLKVLELGAGTGTYAALLAREGAMVTLLDYSPAALSEAKQWFKAQNLTAQFIQADVLHLPPSLTKQKFDITISIGLAEHFVGRDRAKVLKAHLDCLRKGGIAVIAVPNCWNPPYRIYKLVAELLGKWKFGLEVPYSRQELRHWTHTLKATYLDVVGDDLYSSLKFLLPAHFLRRWFGIDFPRTLKEIKPEKGTPLDGWLGYSLSLIMQKN